MDNPIPNSKTTLRFVLYLRNCQVGKLWQDKPTTMVNPLVRSPDLDHQNTIAFNKSLWGKNSNWGYVGLKKNRFRGFLVPPKPAFWDRLMINTNSQWPLFMVTWSNHLSFRSAIFARWNVSYPQNLNNELHKASPVMVACWHWVNSTEKIFNHHSPII